MSTTLAALSLGFTALAAHPFTTYPASLALLRRLRGTVALQPAPEAAPPRYSLLVCAHNEERVILDKLRNLQALLDRLPGRAEALVYVDGSSDRTAALLLAHPDLRIRVETSDERTGKTVGLNRLAALARGEVLVLSDANVEVAEDVLDRLDRYFADPAVGLVCGHLSYTNGGESTTAQNGSLYWKLEEAVRALETETGSAIGADGSLYAVRRRLWPAVPADLIDDFFVPMTVRAAGFRVVHGPDLAAFERGASDRRDEFRRKVRIACQAMNVHRALGPVLGRLGALDRYKYVSHKLLKWLVGFNLALGAGFGLLGFALAFDPVRALSLAILIADLIALGLVLKLRPVPALYDALQMVTAVALGVIRSFQGERFQTWQPAASVRLADVGPGFATPRSGSAPGPTR